MIEKRSLVAYKIHREGADKFEYYVVGLTGALCAYVSQHMEPEKIGWNPYTLELSALLLLIGAFAAGFRRIHIQTMISGINQEILHLNEVKGEIVRLRNQARTSDFVLGEYGEIESFGQLDARLHQTKNNLSALDVVFSRMQAKAIRCYHIRNRLLCIGFVALVLSRILIPYCSTLVQYAK